MIEKEDYFKTFCRISKAFGTALEKEPLLDLIVASAVETMEAKAACLWLGDPLTGKFSPMAQKGLSENYFHTPLKYQNILSEVTEKGYLHAEDATTDPRLEDHEGKKAEKIASMLIVPVNVKDKVIGVLSLYTSEIRNFTEREIEFLRALADHGGMAIENARLLENLRTNSRLFLDLCSKINSSLNIEEILGYLSEETCKVLGMKGIVIRLFNEKTGNLDLVASHGLSQKYLDKGLVSAERSISDALAGKTVVIADVAADSRLQYQKQTLEEKILSMVCVPIQVKDKVIGVMRLCSETAREYPEEFIDLIQAVAQTGGLAIQNAAMYLSLQEDKRNLEKDFWWERSYH